MNERRFRKLQNKVWYQAALHEAEIELQMQDGKIKTTQLEPVTAKEMAMAVVRFLIIVLVVMGLIVITQSLFLIIMGELKCTS